jgi:hypothetical protein
MDEFHRKEHHILRLMELGWSWQNWRGSESFSGCRRSFPMGLLALMLPGVLLSGAGEE